MALILLIEDDKGVRDFTKQALEKNHLVIEAANSEAALTLTGKVIPDLTILDVMLEGSEQTGAELRHTLSGAPRLAGMPILVVSGYTDTAEISAALGVGDAAFLVKPFSGEQLNEAIDKLLAEQSGVLERALGGASEIDITCAIVAAASQGRLMVIYRAAKEAVARLDIEMQKLGSWSGGPGPE